MLACSVHTALPLQSWPLQVRPCPVPCTTIPRRPGPRYRTGKVSCNTLNIFDEDPNAPSTSSTPEILKPQSSRKLTRSQQGARKGLRGKARFVSNSEQEESAQAVNTDAADASELVFDHGLETENASRPSPAVLDEDNPFYTPALTDEELGQDPPGHKSGYVAVIGKPNAGKSTLINALVGQKLSIVSWKPQTTRHRIVGFASDKEYQMILFDTPGIIEKKRNKLEERMMSAVVTSIQNSEAIIAVVDARDEPKQALSMFQPGPNWTGPPMAVLLNKADQMEAEAIEGLKQWYKDNCRAEAVFVGCALSGGSDEGVQQIKQWAVSKMPEGPTLYPKDIVSEQPERFFVAEIIREKIFGLYAQEIPYACQVQVAEFKERGRVRKFINPDAKDAILADILVEKDSQVGIIIGKRGDMLARLQADAKKDIEEFLERPVRLEFKVKVAKGWRASQDALTRFGYFDPMLI